MNKIFIILSLLVLTLIITACNNNVSKCNNGLSWCELKNKCIAKSENCLGLTQDPNNNCTSNDNVSFSCVVNDTVVKINQLP